jgi:hypothetical protein
MKLAAAFDSYESDQVKAALDGGVLKIYSVARPPSPDTPVTRSGLLATFKFASPAFGSETPSFVENQVSPEGVGTPGFARAFTADGKTPVADFSVGPGSADIALSEVSTTPGYKVSVVRFRLG